MQEMDITILFLSVDNYIYMLQIATYQMEQILRLVIKKNITAKNLNLQRLKNIGEYNQLKMEHM